MSEVKRCISYNFIDLRKLVKISETFNRITAKNMKT